MKRACFLLILFAVLFLNTRVVLASQPVMLDCVDIDVAQKIRAEKIVYDEYPELANLNGSTSFVAEVGSDHWCTNFVSGGRPADKLNVVVNYLTPKSYSNFGTSYVVTFNVEVVDATGSVLTDSLIERPKNVRSAIEEFEKNKRVLEAVKLFKIATSTIHGESVSLKFLRGEISYGFASRATNYTLPVADNYINFPEINLGIHMLEKAGFRVPRTEMDGGNAELKHNGPVKIIDGVYFLSGSNSESYGKDFDWATLSLDVIENAGKTVGLLVHVYADGRYLVEPEVGGSSIFGRITTPTGECTFQEFVYGSLPSQSLGVSFTDGCSSRLSPKLVFLDLNNNLVDDKDIEILQSVENRANASSKIWVQDIVIFSAVVALVAFCGYVYSLKILRKKTMVPSEKDQWSDTTYGKIVDTKQGVGDL